MKKQTIYVIRQTQEAYAYVAYAFVAHEKIEDAKKECEELNKKYGSGLLHYYEVDQIELYKGENLK